MKTTKPRLALLALLAVAACNPYLMQQSVAPPGRSARLDEVTGFWGNITYYRLELSEGVALALTCQHANPCEKLKVLSDDPAVAEVRTASLSQLQSGPYAMSNPQPASAFVIVGKKPGSTRIKVSAREGHRTVVVTVVAPPVPNPQTVATGLATR